jgi:hypothetical protein
VSAAEQQPSSVGESREKALNKRLDTIAWAFFLIMIGCLGLVPKAQVPEGTWLVGVGIIWLGLNAARYFNRIKMSSGTIILGILAIAAGSGSLAGVKIDVLPVLLILLGAHLLLRHFYEDRPARG